jgi:endonuclease III
MKRAERASEIRRRLRAAYPDAHCELDHADPLQLLVATILSAQCTDKRVNLVTPALFRRYPTAAHYARAEPAQLEAAIRSTGFFRNKAKSILGATRAIVERHAGQVPDTMEDLTALPGVGRKTANVILGNAFAKNEGVVVDTHVGRVSRRLDLTRASTPEKIEVDLMNIVPREDWALFSHLLIRHGRTRCTARKPDCAGCELRQLCPSAEPAPVPTPRTRARRRA